MHVVDVELQLNLRHIIFYRIVCLNAVDVRCLLGILQYTVNSE